jgi:hypothetical protein
MIPTFLTKNGEVYINDLRRYCKGTILVPAEARMPITMAALAGSPPIAVEGPQDAATEIFSLMGNFNGAAESDATKRLKVKIHDVAYRRDLMNRPILVSQVFGSGQRPGRLHESIVLEGQQTLTFEFTNSSTDQGGAEVNYNMSLEARTFQSYGVAHPQVRSWLAEQRDRKAYLAPYWWTTDNDLTITAGAENDVLFTNTSDKFLLLCDILASSISANTTSSEGTEPLTFELWDAKTGRRMMNQPVTLSTGTGNVQYPFRLEDPLLVEPSTQLVARFKSLLTGVPQDVFFTFSGVQCLADPATFAQGQMTQPTYAGLPMGRF